MFTAITDPTRPVSAIATAAIGGTARRVLHRIRNAEIIHRRIQIFGFLAELSVALKREEWLNPYVRSEQRRKSAKSSVPARWTWT